jgi:hypothetical protein
MTSIIMYILFISICVGCANYYTLRLPDVRIDYMSNKYISYAVKTANQPIIRHCAVSFAVLLLTFLIRYHFDI